MAAFFEIPLDALLVTLAGGYFFGAVPFGLLLTRFAGLGDIQKIGSGNIGATNVLRSGSKGLALLTLLLDGGKGAAAVAIGLTFSPTAAMFAGGSAVLGHLFPVWLRFRGGKGVSTTLGVLLALAPPIGLLTCAVWLLIAFLFRYSSLAALVAIGASPIFAWLSGHTPLAAFLVPVAALVFLRHRANIRRLLHGEEPKIGAKAPSDS